jgi:membrane glycosyltransferase
MEKRILLSVSFIILALSIVFASVWIGFLLQKLETSQNSNSTPINRNILNVSKVAEYLNMTEEDVQGIIYTEKMKLEKTGSFSGVMFPYFIINDKYYFYRDEIDEWLKDVSKNHRQYNTTKGLILQ